MRVMIQALLAMSALLGLSSTAPAQSYSCNGPAQGSSTATQYTCQAPLATFNITTTFNTSCIATPIFGGATFSSGPGSQVSVSASGECGLNTPMAMLMNADCLPTFSTMVDGSTITAIGQNNAYMELAAPFPFCVNQSTQAGSSSTCPTVLCNECSLQVDACTSAGCNSAGGYICSSAGCCVVNTNGPPDDDDGGDCDGANGCSCSDASECDSGNCNGSTCEGLDPVIFDLAGRGYQLTNVQSGVKFDFYGTGTPIQMSWTAGNWLGGLLALDRNGNGRIDDAAELFSNLTPQPAPTGNQQRTGFLALAVYDQPANGGNGDGWIDKQDKIFPQLLIWVDTNHNGISEANELLTLEQAGIQAISLSPSPSQWVDANGNIFRYVAGLRATPPASQVVYDVMLQQLHYANGASAAAVTKRASGGPQ